ncbi:MAG: hypothetical protein M3164_07395 [Actinomycetota bacterium]|nr:hypothetical protein [Actinomycetota bacterium]
MILDQGRAEGVGWRLVLRPGNPACLELQPTRGTGGSIVCDEESEQDFNGDERLRFIFGGVNEVQVPKFVFGFAVTEVARVRVDLASGESPGVATSSSPPLRGKRFFVVPLDPEPASEIEAVRGLNQAGAIGRKLRPRRP